MLLSFHLRKLPDEVLREILAFVTRAQLEILQLTSSAFDVLVERYFFREPLRRFKRLVVKETLSTSTAPSDVPTHCLAQLGDHVDPSCIFPLTDFLARTRLCVFDEIVIDLTCPERADAGPRLQALLEVRNACASGQGSSLPKRSPSLDYASIGANQRPRIRWVSVSQPVYAPIHQQIR